MDFNLNQVTRETPISGIRVPHATSATSIVMQPHNAGFTPVFTLLTDDAKNAEVATLMNARGLTRGVTNHEVLLPAQEGSAPEKHWV